MNININKIDYKCAPIVKEGFNGKSQNIGWMCSEKKNRKIG